MRLFLGQPNAGQIKSRLPCALQSQAVCGQAQARNMRIKIPRRKVPVRNFLEKYSEIHIQTIAPFTLAVNVSVVRNVLACAASTAQPGSNWTESVMSALSTRETGQFALAFLAISSNLAASMPGTLPFKSR